MPRIGVSPVLLALGYALGASAWIVFSDRALAALSPDLSSFSYYGTFKGLGFVGASTLILWVILTRHRSRLEEEIATRDRSEAATRATEERLRVATSAANVGLWDWDVAANRVFYSAEWKRQIGYEPHEITDSFDEWQSRVHPDDLPAALENLQRQLEGAAMQFENLFRFRHRDGSYRWILVQASVHRNASGRAVRVLGSHIDITDRRRSEETLRQHEIALATAYEAADLGVWHLALPSTVLTMDGRARAHLGFDRDTCSLEEVIERVHPEDRERLRGEIAAAMAPEATGRAATEYRVVHPDGQLHWLSIHVYVAFEGAGPQRRATGASGTSQDITGRKRAEDALRDSEERLRQAQKMEAIGQLAGGVAHDFNNILVVIHGNVELIRTDPALSPDLRECCDEIVRAAERAAGLTRQLLLFSRRQVMQFGDLDLNAVVAETTTMLRRVLGENIELRVRCSPGALRLHADRGMLDLVLLNLAVNARDAMGDTGTLTVETAEIVRDGGRFARIDVRDSGEGIPPDILPRIFEPFFTTKEVGKGTGLGLATVFGVVREHGGTVEVESAVGRGTTFHIDLPLAPRTLAAELGQPDEPLRGGRETILLVEDEAPVRTLMAEVLSRLGYEILTAVNGVEALDVVRSHEHRVALVVTDLVMPGGVSGLELGRELARRDPRLRFIYTSGFSPAGARMDLVEGVNFLPKPFSPWVLARLVRNRLDAA